MKFKYVKEDDSTYVLYARGAGLLTGIQWHFIGEFPNKEFMKVTAWGLGQEAHHPNHYAQKGTLGSKEETKW